MCMKDNRENHTVLTAFLIAIVIVLPLPCGHRRVRDSPIDRSSLNTIAQHLGEARKPPYFHSYKVRYSTVQ